MNHLDLRHLRARPLREICELLPAVSIVTAGDVEVNVVTTACLTEAGFDQRGIKKARMKSEDLRRGLLKAGEVLIARSNTPELVGRCAVFGEVEGAVYASDLLIRLRPYADVSSAYLGGFLSHLFLSGYWRERASGASGTMKKITRAHLHDLLLPFPNLKEQQRIAVQLRERLAIADSALRAVERQVAAASVLPGALTREDTSDPETTSRLIGEVLEEVTEGIGEAWRGQPVLGATRAGLAPAKEGVGKQAHRYKPVTPGTVFYNPMRILLGSIALVDDGDAPGITSPDYVVVRGREGVLHPVWFYYWFRSPAGAEFIQSLTRGAVRERLLFNRLAAGRILVPPWPRQLATVERVRAAQKARLSFAARLKVIEKLPAALLREAFGNGGSVRDEEGSSDSLTPEDAMATETVA